MGGRVNLPPLFYRPLPPYTAFLSFRHLFGARRLLGEFA